jgi:hypothetical protein
VDDFRGVHAFLDDALAEEDNHDSAMLLAAKVFALAQFGGDEEINLAFRDLVHSLGDRTDLLPLPLAQGRYCIGLALGELGEHAAAERALSDVATFYQGDDDPGIRKVAISALGSRIRELSNLGDTDKVRDAWASLRDAYGPDLDLGVRKEVARAGRSAAGRLLDAGRVADALTISDNVIALYESDTDPTIRGLVAVTLWVRIDALRASKQPVARWRTRRQLLHFIGTNPEAEVIEALRRANPTGADWILRHAHDPH